MFLKDVESELIRDKRPEVCNRNRPMREQKVVPGLLHDPGAGRVWPRAMCDALQQRMQGISLLPATNWPLRIHKDGG